MPEAQHRRLAAIMFTDMVGYTAVMGEDEPKALRLLQKNRDFLRPIIQKFNGEWLKEMTVPSPLLPASWTRLTAPGFTQTSAPLQGRRAAPANCSCQARRGLLTATGSSSRGCPAGPGALSQECAPRFGLVGILGQGLYLVCSRMDG